MNTVLVTGATGFIGRSALVKLVDRGFDVHAVARSAGKRADGRVTWHEANLLDDAQRSLIVGEVKASHLLHLAWYAEPGAFWAALENVDWVAASVRLLGEFAEAGGRRAVLAGTCAEYDWGGPGVLREDAPLAPATLYGVCKDATRRVAEAIGEARGLRVAWGRIFFVYGPGEDERRLVAGVAKALVAGDRAPTSSGEQVRDFLHVDDAAGAFAALVDSAVTGAVNVGSGVGVPVRHVVELVAEAASSPELLDVGALPPREGDPPEIVADAGRLQREVGFEPAIPLEQGIEQTVRWWRQQ